MARILIVEDEKALNEAYQLILQKEGHATKATYDGEEALKAAEKFDPELILLDLRMPKMNGIEFLKAYDPLNKHKNVKIIIFSNLDMQSEIDEAYSYGAGRYMLKAWASPSELGRLIKQTLEDKSVTKSK